MLNRIELGQEASNLTIRFEVDPTNLEIQEDLVPSQFTDIIMNFPLQANGLSLGIFSNKGISFSRDLSDKCAFGIIAIIIIIKTKSTYSS